MRQDISSAANGAPDPDFAASLRSLDDTVGRTINDIASQLKSGTTSSVFDRLVTADILGRVADPNHVYSCYAGYSRSNHDR